MAHAGAGMVWFLNQVKPSHKSVPPTVRYPRVVPTLLVFMWFILGERERVSVKNCRRCGVTVMVVEPSCWPAQVWFGTRAR